MVFPPDCILADDLTITWVTGKPPINPDTILPAPCATSSLLVGVTLFEGLAYRWPQHIAMFLDSQQGQ